MGTQKYLCHQCQETFELLEISSARSIHCPRCAAADIQEFNACSLGVEAPPWEYLCHGCQARFRVKSPQGPDEAKSIRCPVCQSKDVAWLALATGACATGG